MRICLINYVLQNQSFSHYFPVYTSLSLPSIPKFISFDFAAFEFSYFTFAFLSQRRSSSRLSSRVLTTILTIIFSKKLQYFLTIKRNWPKGGPKAQQQSFCIVTRPLIDILIVRHRSICRKGIEKKSEVRDAGSRMRIS